jgi:alanine racemase
MSHLACSDQESHPQNEQQLHTFQTILQCLPPAPASFANSNGIFLGQRYHFDIVRPGRSLYGLEPRSSNRLVARIYAKILQIRTIPAQQPVGYDATFIAPHPMTVATLGIGYADGLNRALSNKGAVYFAGVICPIIGRVSMDLMVIDVSQVPESFLNLGLWVEIMGDYMRPDDLARTANTISREILAHLGPRMHRIYKGANEA